MLSFCRSIELSILYLAALLFVYKIHALSLLSDI